MSPSGAVPAAAGLCIARCPPCPPRTTGARTAARSAPLREPLPHTAAAAGWGRRGHTLSHLGARGGAPLPPPPPKRLERPLFLSPGACSVDALYGTQDRQRGAPRRHGWLARRALPRGGCGRRGRTKPLLGGTTGGCASRNGRHGRLRVSWCRPLWRGAGPLVPPPLPFEAAGVAARPLAQSQRPLAPGRRAGAEARHARRMATLVGGVHRRWGAWCGAGRIHLPRARPPPPAPQACLGWMAGLLGAEGSDGGARGARRFVLVTVVWKRSRRSTGRAGSPRSPHRQAPVAAAGMWVEAVGGCARGSGAGGEMRGGARAALRGSPAPAPAGALAARPPPAPPPRPLAASRVTSETAWPIPPSRR